MARLLSRRLWRIVVAVLLTTLSGLSRPAGAASQGEEASPAEALSLDTLRTPGLQVVFGEGDSIRAVRMLRLLSPPPALPGLPVGIPSQVVLNLAPSEEAFQALIGSTPPEWGAAVAIPSRAAIVMPAYPTRRLAPPDLPRVLLHEWAHLGLHEYLGELRVPRWFSEGYAEWASGGWSVSEGWKLRVAIAMNRTPALDSLELGWPRDRAAAEVAYLLSGSAVAYLARNGGEDGIALFLSRWKDSGRFEEALRRTYGVTVSQFEEDWKKHVRREYGWLMVLSRSVLFWILLTVALAGMLWMRRRYNRVRMARLRASEPPDLPAFWSGPVEDAGTTGSDSRAPPDGGASVTSWGEPLTPGAGPSVRVVRPLRWYPSEPPKEE